MIRKQNGFTIIELLIVIFVIGILAAIGVIAYGNWRTNIEQNKLKNDLNQARAAMEDARNFSSTYPVNVNTVYTPTSGVTMTGGSSDGTQYCITATSVTYPSMKYYINNTSTDPQAGECLADGSSLQSMTAAQCTALSTYTGSNDSALRTLSDSRDSNSYRIGKLADNKCWMLDNLKLGSTSSTTALTSANTNITSSWSLPQVVSSGASYTSPYAYGSVPGDTGSGATNYGYLYNWCAATAGGTASGGNDTCTASFPATPSQNDICPKSWRLPTGGTGGEFSTLHTAMGSSYTNWQYTGAFKGVFSGSRNSSSFLDQGSYGLWWSRSGDPGNALYAFYVYFNSSSVGPTGGVNRNNGFAIRCLLN